jgi:hypothetical protein
VYPHQQLCVAPLFVTPGAERRWPTVDSTGLTDVIAVAPPRMNLQVTS